MFKNIENNKRLSIFNKEMLYQLNFKADKIDCKVNLPLSKSISNRLLIIRALSDEKATSAGISDSDDTRVLFRGLQSKSETVDVGHAGTSMRFLTAYFAATAQKKIITGSARMQERPIRDLVEALNQLGADIRYLGKEGFPPVQTSDKKLSGNAVHINGNISSQFITALLLIAPALPNGLAIHINGELVSKSYVKMTLALMLQAGVSAKIDQQAITVAAQKYSAEGIECERDWSAASYWYEIAALSNDAHIQLTGITADSLQGDAVIARIFAQLGVETVFYSGGAYLRKGQPQSPAHFEFDFINAPDIAQTVAVCLCMKNIPFRLTGLKTLRVKETDRIAALQNELGKFGFPLKEPQAGVLEWDGERRSPQKAIRIATYHDHRMAMAFAPTAIVFPEIGIENPDVVSKSYPQFWEALEGAGCMITPKNG
ncbi:3-phosphoshikimate 1-carboxyvinyltransferase [Bacteroidia bacterium]|nr:3-phosphoshikimate 1-carboxyvinyltransferase [Bacteroidia bacterium]